MKHTMVEPRAFDFDFQWKRGLLATVREASSTAGLGLSKLELLEEPWAHQIRLACYFR